MKILVFDIKAPLAHFKKPDATATHLTYPFITRTAIRGMMGAILGLEEFNGKALIGIQLLKPIQTSSQELSLLGKGFLSSGGSFNRPTAIELLVEPHYRIFYSGDYYHQLSEAIKNSNSCYHTYMGSGFAPTFPLFIEEVELEEEMAEVVTSITVVPTNIIGKLQFYDNSSYARVGGMQYEYLGDRTFSGTINLIYEIEGKAIQFHREGIDSNGNVKVLKYKNGECICLW